MYCIDEAPSLGVFAKLSEFINEYRLEDIKRENEAQEVIWQQKIRPALATRMKKIKEQQQQSEYVDLSQLNAKDKQDWTTEQLELRLAAAEELLPMPPEDD